MLQPSNDAKHRENKQIAETDQKSPQHLKYPKDGSIIAHSLFNSKEPWHQITRTASYIINKTF